MHVLLVHAHHSSWLVVTSLFDLSPHLVPLPVVMKVVQAEGEKGFLLLHRIEIQGSGNDVSELGGKKLVFLVLDVPLFAQVLVSLVSLLCSFQLSTLAHFLRQLLLFFLQEIQVLHLSLQ